MGQFPDLTVKGEVTEVSGTLRVTADPLFAVEEGFDLAFRIRRRHPGLC